MIDAVRAPRSAAESEKLSKAKAWDWTFTPDLSGKDILSRNPALSLKLVTYLNLVSRSISPEFSAIHPGAVTPVRRRLQGSFGMLGLREVVAVEVHDLVPSSDEILDELFLGIGCRIDFGHGAELGV